MRVREDERAIEDEGAKRVCKKVRTREEDKAREREREYLSTTSSCRARNSCAGTAIV
jgi:hypothetical protein